MAMNSYRNSVNSFIAASNMVKGSRIYGHNCAACVLTSWCEYVSKDGTEHYYLCSDCDNAIEMYRRGWWTQSVTLMKPQPGVRKKLFADAWKMFCEMVNEGGDITETNAMLVCDCCRKFRTSFEIWNEDRKICACEECFEKAKKNYI
jgi:hypothetical protein